jgi:hypothetical protein
MKRFLLGFAVGLSFAALPAAAQQGPTPLKQADQAAPPAPTGYLLSLNNEQLQSVLAELELQFSSEPGPDNSTTMVIDFGGTKASLYQYIESRKITSLRLSAGFSVRAKPTADAVNAFNRASRYAKCYVDDDQDPFLVMDLDVAHGLTRLALMEWVLAYEESLEPFGVQVLGRRPKSPAGQ